MRQTAMSIAIAVSLSWSAVAWAAGTRGTPQEAKAMLQKAVGHYKEAGRKQAIADFNAKKAPFGDRDLYVFCLAKDDTLIANGGFPSYVGINEDSMRDADGRPMGKQLWKAASAGGKGYFEYRWINPVTRAVEPKISFVQRVGDDLCGVGAYNPPK